MKRKRYAMMLIVVCLISFIIIPGTTFANMADGTYQVNYQILKAENDSVSMANDYFEKPATLIVDKGKKYIQLTINHSDWIKTFTTASGEPAQVISENKSADTRVVKFPVNDLSKPVPMKMHVLIETMDPVYDHEYTVRFDFDSENLNTAGSGPEQTKNEKTDDSGKHSENNGASTNKAPEKNPKTSDNAPVGFYLLLFVIALLFFIRKKQIN
ncbi:heme uptake protein IsdC [Siminovitchia sp. FSL H7-0308]|uniref:heme uptake protein IsdC n=1 Tax=Siminovitchia sp. FSL H7-0308 TaxID=2921432 RepID=UPI0030ED6A55